MKPSMNLSDYFSVRTQAFGMLDGPLTYDVYLRLSPEKFTKVFSHGQVLERERLQSYYDKGTRNLFVEVKDRALFLSSSVGVLEYLRKQNTYDNEESQQILDEITFGCLTEIYANNRLDPHSRAVLNVVVESYIELATNQPQVFPQLLKLARKRPALVRHQVMASVFATLLAATYDPKDKDLMKTVGMAGMVHDIGMSSLAIIKDEHAMNLTQSELAALHQHPQKAIEIMGGNMSAEVKTAILQHHEAYDGTGYPNSLSKEMICLPARILRIAEEFSGLVSGSDSSFPLAPAMAAHAMTKSTAVDPHLLSLFVKMLKLA